jgi:hypothetical protein
MKQIVPDEVIQTAPKCWNAQADEYNQWEALGLDEQFEWIASRAAQWAMEMAAQKCHQEAARCASMYDKEGQSAAAGCYSAIRAMMQEVKV